MRSKLLIGFLWLQTCCACSESTNNSLPSDSDMDAARNFIRASLDNKFGEAKNYIIPDSTNNGYLDAAKRNRANLTKEENLRYRDASIRIYDTRKINDSISIISYSNSYKNQKDSLKVVRLNGQWLVDFKYSFPGDSAK